MIVYENVPMKLLFFAQLWKICQKSVSFLSVVYVAHVVKLFPKYIVSGVFP